MDVRMEYKAKRITIQWEEEAEEEERVGQRERERPRETKKKNELLQYGCSS